MSAYLEQLSHNQVLFREVNERVREMLDGSVGASEFLCECSNEGCTETVALELAEYERIRSHSNRFVVRPGHEITAIERVVYECDRYKLVEETSGADYAIRNDPRTRGED